MKACYRKSILAEKVVILFYINLASRRHMEHIYIEFTVSAPSIELGPPTPSLASECAPLEPKVVRLSPAGELVGGPNSDDRRKILALCLFCETCFLSQLRLKHLGDDRKQCPEYITSNY
jgi:hypothetical protein